MEQERRWIGRIRPGSEAEHEKFLVWLSSDEGARIFRQYRLTGYEVRQAGDRLAVLMRTEEPIAIVRFLRNHGAWPEFWEFQSNMPVDTPSEAITRVSWTANVAEK